MSNPKIYMLLTAEQASTVLKVTKEAFEAVGTRLFDSYKADGKPYYDRNEIEGRREDFEAEYISWRGSLVNNPNS
jgi:hypothetical protein